MLKRELKKQLRTAQTHFPWLRDAKFASYNWATRNLGWRVEPEFKLLEKLAPCKLAVDIGANRGQSIYALKRHARPRTIISFEPNPPLATKLKSNFSGDPQVQIEAFALGDSAGELELFVPAYGGYEYDGLASVDYDSAAKWLSAKRMARFDPDKIKISREKIAVKTLDSYGLLPDIIKIDVQGHEEAVIAGAAETISEAKPVVILEDPTLAIIDRLKGFGLNQYALIDGAFVPDNLTRPNSLFLSEEKKAKLSVSS